MKLTTITQVTVDGVVQGNGGRGENRSGGFDRGGWALPLFDDDAMGFVNEIYASADAFLFGRRTYELFAGYWGTRGDLQNPIVAALNTRPKFVASTTLDEPRWAGTSLLSGNLGPAVAELKARPGGELQVHGSGSLVRQLLALDVVDELILLVCPVVVGSGTRLFPQDGPDLALEHLETRVFPQGITAQRFRPSGRPSYAP